MSYSENPFFPSDAAPESRIKLDNVVARRSNKTIYRDGDKSIKVFDLNFPKTDILNEALNQSRVEVTPLNTPRLLEVLKLDGRWAIVSEYISGKTLADLMRDNPDKFDEYLHIFVEMQLVVQAQHVSDLNDLRDKMSRRIARAGLSEERRAELSARLSEMADLDSVCHGDFFPTNIIIAAYGTPYIIDWSHVTQGDPAADAALTYLLFVTNGQPDHADRYLDVYCELSGADKEHVGRLIPVVAAAHAEKAPHGGRDILIKYANGELGWRRGK